MPEVVVARLARMSVPRQFAAEVAALAEKGASVSGISRALGLSWETVQAAQGCHEDGGPAELVPTVRTAGGDLSEPPLYMRIAEEVSRRRDEDHESFPSIAKALEVSPSTVTHAYDWKHRNELVASVNEGHAPDRGHVPRLGVAVHEKVARLLKADRRPAEIAVEAGCSRTTVYRVRRTLRGSSDVPKAELIADEVARRRDEEGHGFARIAEDLGVCRRTVRRAYDLKHPEELVAAGVEGRAPDRGRAPQLGVEKHHMIRSLIDAGWAAPQIAAEVGCGESTVYLARKAMKAPRPTSKFEQIAEEVVRRRDEEGQKVVEIAKDLGVCKQTVRQAYLLGTATKRGSAVT
jgi:hypothetical protein